ncbi:MAG: DUF493 domain-containing protein [Deferribacterales bacterium]|nr:DUF493 domain-containing protein [Deferribacterales bacterium]
MSGLKELQEFPAIFTFKVVLNAGEQFKAPLQKIFCLPDREVTITEKESTGGKYTSYSVTTVIMEYEELEKFYNEISRLDGLKFYV